MDKLGKEAAKILADVRNALKISFCDPKTSKIARLRRAIPHLDKFLVGDHKTSQIQDFSKIGRGMEGGGPPD